MIGHATSLIRGILARMGRRISVPEHMDRPEVPSSCGRLTAFWLRAHGGVWTGRTGRLGWTALIAGLVVLVACSGPAENPAQVTPIAHHATPTPMAPGPLNPLPRPRSRHEPTTVLILGTDRRSSDGGTNNTDTLMLLHLDPNRRRAVILSLPRDLYVEIPGYGQARINAAYAWGERSGSGGLAVARETISTTLGIPVQHVALLDFHAFVTLIDAIGGVDVDVPHAISDPTYPDSGTGYDPFYLSAGQHHLDGATALKYARTRATPGGDFDRTARQRQLLLAVRDRVTGLGLLPGLIAQSPQLWSTLQTAVETDLTLGQIVDLAVTASHVPLDQIVSAGIDQSCTHSWTTPGGAAVLLIDGDATEALIADLFPSPPASAAVP